MKNTKQFFKIASRLIRTDISAMKKFGVGTVEYQNARTGGIGLSWTDTANPMWNLARECIDPYTDRIVFIQNRIEDFKNMRKLIRK
jgi:hypothetical protein